MTSEPEVHAMIKAAEDHAGQAVSLTGYLGTGDDETVRLYESPTTSSHADIPKDAVLHVEPQERTGLVTVIVDADATIIETASRRLVAIESTYTVRYPVDPSLIPEPTAPGYPWLDCQKACEAGFVSRVGEILALRRRAIGPEGVALAEQAQAEATAALDLCLRTCPANPFYTAEQIVNRIVDEYLGVPPALPDTQ